jgi:hypothetical protein
MKNLFLLVPLCAASVAATADSIATGPKPHESILTSVRAVRNNDLGAVLQAVLTDDQLAEMEAEWNQQRKQPVDPQESAQFQMVMTMLTAPGAEDMLMAQVEPKLAEMRPQVAMMVGMFSGLLQASLEQDQTLQPAEKDRAAKVIEAIGQVLLENDITSSQNAKHAIDILCRSARSSKIMSMQEVNKLSFDQLIDKGDIFLKGTKDMLAVYGLDTNEWLDTVEAETVSVDGDHAVVRITYEVLGVEETFDAEMVRVDDRWIRKEAAELGTAVR